MSRRICSGDCGDQARAVPSRFRRDDCSLPPGLRRCPAVGAPLIEDGHVTGAINLLRRSVTDYRSGEPTAREPDETEAAIIEEHWDPLIESIIEESEDETLLDRHLSGEPIDLDIVLPDLRAAVATGRFFPIIPAHAPTGMGIEGLLRAV